MSDNTRGTIENLIAGGFYPTAQNLHADIAALFKVTEQGGRLLDPCAGEGDALVSLAEAWGMQAYGAEENEERANKLFERLPNGQASIGDFFQTAITPASFDVIYLNPPYFNYGIERSELEFTDRALNYLTRDGGLLLLVMYRHNIKEDLIEKLWRYSKSITPYFMENQQGYRREYEQVLLVCEMGRSPNKLEEMSDTWAREIMDKYWFAFNNKPTWEDYQQTEDDRPMLYIEARDMEVPDPHWVPRLIQREVYPDPPREHASRDFTRTHLTEALIEFFASDKPLMSVAEAAELARETGAVYSITSRAKELKSFRCKVLSEALLRHVARSLNVHNSTKMNDLLKPEPEQIFLQPPLPIRYNQAAGVVTSGAGGDMLITDEDGRRCWVHTSITRERQVRSTETIANDEGTPLESVATVIELPVVNIVKLYEDGEITNVTGDDGLSALLEIHGRTMIDTLRVDFPPMYNLEDDPAWEELKPFVDKCQPQGKYELIDTQKHVIIGTAKSFEERSAFMLIGEMGTGKTVMTASIASIMRDRALSMRFSSRKARKIGNAVIMPGEIVIGIVPPSVSDEKWIGEFTQSVPNVHAMRLTEYEHVNEIKRIADLSKAAGERCKAAWSKGEVPSQEDIDLASRLIVGVTPESIAKRDESWAHAYSKGYERHRRWGDGGWEYVRTPALFNPMTGEKIMMAEDAPRVGKYGEARTGSRNWYRGSSTVENLEFHKPNKMLDNSEEYRKAQEKAQAALEQLEGRLVYDEVMRDRIAVGDMDRREFTHKKTKRYIKIVDSEGKRREHGVQCYWTHEAQAMKDVREERIKNDKSNRQPVPCWQDIRGRYALDAAGQLKEKTGKDLLPLPTTVHEHLKPAQYLVGHSEDWKQGRPVTLAAYIVHELGGRIALCFADELHQYASQGSNRSEAFSVLFNAARKNLGLTGTPYGGKASSIQLLMFLYSQEAREYYPDPTSAATKQRWIEDMGVFEYTITTKHTSEGGRYGDGQQSVGAYKEAPGASPALLRLLLNSAIFIGMKDMGKELAPFVQVPVEITMSPPERARYSYADNVLMTYLKKCIDNKDASFTGMYFNTMLGLASAPWRDEEVWHNQTVSERFWEQSPSIQHTTTPEDIYRWHHHPDADPAKGIFKIRRMVTRIPGLPAAYLSRKEQWLINLVKSELAAGRRVALPLQHTDTKDIQPRLKDILEQYVEDANVYILNKSVPTDKRAKHIREKAEEGVNVFIANARSIEVGIDMKEFPTIVIYEPIYSLYTAAQVARRAWRLDQDVETACLVYYPYLVKETEIEGMPRVTRTMEHRAVDVVARKQRASDFLTGDSTGGLADLASDFSLTDEMLREVTSDRSESVFVDTREIFRDINQDQRIEVNDYMDFEDMNAGFDAAFRELREEDFDGEIVFTNDNVDGMSLDQLTAFIEQYTPDGEVLSVEEVQMSDTPIDEEAEIALAAMLEIMESDDEDPVILDNEPDASVWNLDDIEMDFGEEDFVSDEEYESEVVAEAEAQEEDDYDEVSECQYCGETSEETEMYCGNICMGCAENMGANWDRQIEEVDTEEESDDQSQCEICGEWVDTTDMWGEEVCSTCRETRYCEHCQLYHEEQDMYSNGVCDECAEAIAQEEGDRLEEEEALEYIEELEEQMTESVDTCIVCGNQYTVASNELTENGMCADCAAMMDEMNATAEGAPDSEEFVALPIECAGCHFEFAMEDLNADGRCATCAEFEALNDPIVEEEAVAEAIDERMEEVELVQPAELEAEDIAIGDQIAAEIMAEMETEETVLQDGPFVPEYSPALYDKWLDTLDQSQRAAVHRVMQRKADYNGIRITRQEFVERSARALFDVEHLPEPVRNPYSKNELLYVRAGDFAITNSEAYYLHFIHEYNGTYAAFAAGQDVIPQYDNDMSHSAILQAA